MPNKSAALEKEMKVRSAKPNKWLRFYRCIPLYLMFLPGALYLLMCKAFSRCRICGSLYGR